MLPVHERFHTFQGEGVHAGRSAFFIRTYGCPVKCVWCDSAGTWHPNFTPKHSMRFEEHQLVREAVEAKAAFIVITGGEPTIHDLRDLCSHAHRAHVPVHLETCGAFDIRGRFDWITLSPKTMALPLDENVARASEFKFIIEDEADIGFWTEMMRQRGASFPRQTVWLHPEWSQRENPRVLEAIIKAVRHNGNLYRAGWQLHKLYRADALDPRTQPLVPLGGDPRRGY